MVSIEDKVKMFLRDNLDEMMENWTTEIKVEPHDIPEKIHENGQAVFDLVTAHIVTPLPPDTIKSLAKKIATERVDGGINIGNFVYNFNLGRSEIFKHLHKIDIPMDALQEIVNRINNFFDQFEFHAVTYYTDLKNKVIEEKNQLLSEMHKDRLTILGQMTSSFVHECRNPLTSIMGFVKLLQSENPSIKYMDTIGHELKQLEFRISQFLLLSKKEVLGKQEQSFSIKELIEEINDFLYPSITDNNITVHLSLEDIEYVGFRDEIKQVLVNLVFNSIDALEHCETNKVIVVSAEQVRDRISIKVSNNGPPIPKQSLKTIFEPFVTTKKLGTGLGLFVCREIIQKHKGKLYCQSDEEKTCFSIEL